MATRTISTKLAIEGETEYRQKVSQINSELKTLSSELKLVESSFAGQQNSIDALTAKGTALQNSYDKQAQKVNELKSALANAQAAQQTYNQRAEEARTKISASEEALEKLKNSTGDTSTEQKKLTDEITKYKVELSEAERYQQSSEKGVNDWQRQVNNAQVELNSLDREIQQNGQYLNEAKASTDGAATSIDKYGNEVKQTAAETENATEKTGLLGNIFAGGFFANIATQALSSITSALKEIASEAFSTADELEKMSSETGFTTTELQKMTYIGDDLGVSLDTQAGALKKLINNMSSAQSGSGTAYEAFKKLNVEYEDGNGALLDSNDVYGKVIDALGDMTNETERDAAAQDLFGKSATDLNPLIEAGSEALSDLADQAEDTGSVMSEDAVKALDATGDALDHVKQKVTAFIGEGLAKLIDSGKSASEEMSDLNDEINGQKSISDLIDKYRSLSTEISDSSLSAEDLATKTSDLEQTKQDLIKASDGVITKLDIENGTFDNQVDALDNATDSQKEYLLWKLKSQLLDASSTNAIENKTKAQQKAEKEEERLNELLDMQAEAQDAIADGDYWYLTPGFGQDGYSWQDKLDGVNDSLDAQKGIVADAADEVAGYAETTAETEEVVRSLVENGFMTADEAAVTLGTDISYINTILAETPTATEPAVSSVDNLASQLEALQIEYTDAKNAALDSINSQMGKWQEMDNQAVTSASSLQEALDSQATYLSNYTTNLNDLKSRNIDGIDELVASLSDGSTESAAILAGLSGASDTEIESIIASLRSVKDGKDDFSSNVAEMQTDYSSRMEAIVSDSGATVEDVQAALLKVSEFKSIGDQDAEGYRQGLLSKEQEIRNAAARLSRAGTTTMKNTSQQRSPSKVYKEIAGLDMDGYYLGMEEKQNKIEKKAKEVSEKGMLAMSKNVPTIYSNTSKSSIGKASFGTSAASKSEYNYGGIVLNVYGSEGQSVNNLADIVMQKIDSAVKKKEAVFA